MSDRADLLLLNASNYWRWPLYPYAFVQISALARARNLRVVRHDFWGTPKELWGLEVERLVAEHQPRLVGITMRNVDSLTLVEYQPWFPFQYLPAEDTHDLVELVRKATPSPVVLGGFGFTAHAGRLFDYFGADLGVTGDPDGFFDRFEDVLASRDLGSVPNLAWREEGVTRFNARAYYDPFPEAEYDAPVFAELEAFYGKTALGDQTIAVEVSRGCPFRCYFCHEPQVKGRKWRYRSLDAVFADVEFLVARNVRRIFFVCSEMNIDGDEFPLKLAARMQALNAGRGASRRVAWTAYNLPTMTNLESLRALVDSGYFFSWNDAQSFDDENIRATKVPYRSRHVVKYLQNCITIEDELKTSAGPPPPGIIPNRILSMFVGNAWATPVTLRRSLRVLQDNGFHLKFEGALPVMATRVLEVDGAVNVPNEPERFVTYPARGRVDVGELPPLVRPTFYFPKAFTDIFPELHDYEEFFSYVSATFMSRKHLETKNWVLFLANTSSPERFARLVGETDGLDAVPPKRLSPPAAGLLGRVLADPVHGARALFFPHDLVPFPLAPPAIFGPPTDSVAVDAAGELLRRLALVRHAEMIPVLAYLGLPQTHEGALAVSEYVVAEAFLTRYESEGAALADLRTALAFEEGSTTDFLLRFWLYAWNVRIVSGYRAALFPTHEPELVTPVEDEATGT